MKYKSCWLWKNVYQLVSDFLQISKFNAYIFQVDSRNRGQIPVQSNSKDTIATSMGFVLAYWFLTLNTVVTCPLEKCFTQDTNRFSKLTTETSEKDLKLINGDTRMTSMRYSCGSAEKLWEKWEVDSASKLWE